MQYRLKCKNLDAKCLTYYWVEDDCSLDSISPIDSDFEIIYKSDLDWR